MNCQHWPNRYEMELKDQLDGLIGAGWGVAEPGRRPRPLGRRAHAPQRGGRRRPQPEDRRPQGVLRRPRAHQRAGKRLDNGNDAIQTSLKYEYR